jgi:glycosyltransferase involved in cell wall biosynthesis
MKSVTVITEPLLHEDFVQFEIVVPILERLRGEFDLTIAAPRITPRVQRALERIGIHSVDGGAYFPPIRRSRDEIPSYVLSWARDSIWGWNGRIIDRALEGREDVRVNISMTTACTADIWFIQSRPLGLALDAMRVGIRASMRVGFAVARPIAGPLDLHHVRQIGARSRIRYSSTRHVGDWFTQHGVPVHGLIPIYYRPAFHPSTTTPSRDYVLVYIGKETDASALRLLLDTGIPVRLFGSKSPGWVRTVVHPERYPNATIYRRIPDTQLCDLYTNARFIAFPFTEESFGLIPIESMACGTPVLTYRKQGPAETVVDGTTGWLVDSPQAFAERAWDLWRHQDPSAMTHACLERARRYHIDTVSDQWREMIRGALSRREFGPAELEPETSRSSLKSTPSASAGSTPPSNARSSSPTEFGPSHSDSIPAELF